jgi:hypothetical protein
MPESTAESHKDQKSKIRPNCLASTRRGDWQGEKTDGYSSWTVQNDGGTFNSWNLAIECDRSQVATTFALFDTR